MEKRSMSSNPYSSTKKFYHHYKLSGHWKVKYWWLHLKLHPINHTTKRRMWRVKIEEDKELFVSLVQREEDNQGVIVAKEVNDTYKMDNRLMPMVATIQFMFSILHLNNPFLEMVQRLVNIGHWYWGYFGELHDVLASMCRHQRVLYMSGSKRSQ